MARLAEGGRKLKDLHTLDKFRLSDAERHMYGANGDSGNGLFKVHVNGRSFKIVASNGGGRGAVALAVGICRCSSVGRAYGLLNPLGLRRSDSGQRPASSQSLAAFRRRQSRSIKMCRIILANPYRHIILLCLPRCRTRGHQ